MVRGERKWDGTGYGVHEPSGSPTIRETLKDDGWVDRLAERYDGDDFYCDVALPNIGALDVVHDSEGVFAFHHTRPFWPVHIVVVPKRHVPSLTNTEGADDALIRNLLSVVQDIASTVETRYGAARVLTNLGTYQDSKHLRVHVSTGDQLC